MAAVSGNNASMSPPPPPSSVSASASATSSSSAPAPVASSASSSMETASNCSSSVSPDPNLPEQNSIESGMGSATGQQQQSCSGGSLETASSSSSPSSGLGSSPLSTSLFCGPGLGSGSAVSNGVAGLGLGEPAVCASCGRRGSAALVSKSFKCGHSMCFACSIDSAAGCEAASCSLCCQRFGAVTSPSSSSSSIAAAEAGAAVTAAPSPPSAGRQQQQQQLRVCTLCPSSVQDADNNLDYERPVQMAVAQCNRCQNFMCPKCVIAHDTIHCSEIRLMDSPPPSDKAYFDQMKTLVCDSREETSRLHSMYEAAGSKLEKSYTGVRNNIQEQFELLGHVIEVRKNELLRKIEEDYASKQGSLAQSKSRIASFVEQTMQLTDFTEGLLMNASSGRIQLVDSPLEKKLLSSISTGRREYSLLKEIDSSKLELHCDSHELQNTLRSAVVLRTAANSRGGLYAGSELSGGGPLMTSSKKQPPISRPTAESSKLAPGASVIDQNVLGLCYLNLNGNSNGVPSNNCQLSPNHGSNLGNGVSTNSEPTTSLSNSFAQSIASFADRSSISVKELLSHTSQTPGAASGYFPASSSSSSSTPQLPMPSLESNFSKYGHLITKATSLPTGDPGLSRGGITRTSSHPYEAWSTSSGEPHKGGPPRSSEPQGGHMDLASAFPGPVDFQDGILNQQNPSSLPYHHQSLLIPSRFTASSQQNPFQQQPSQFGMGKGTDMLATKLATSQPMFTPKSQIKRQKMIYHCKFGEFGVLEGQFTEPSGVAVNAQNDIIVADTNNHRIQIFDKEGRFKFQFGECGKRDGQLLYPNRVAVVRQSGDIIVTERSPTHQVQIYNQYGQFVRKFGANILQHPRGVCVDNKGLIIVIECKVMRVIIFDQMGNVLSKFGCSKHLEFPNGVVVNDRQEIFISDNRAHCVKVFSYEGVFLRQIGGEGITNYPIGVGINAAGEVTIADNHNNFNLSVFSQEGTLLSALESKVKHAQCFDVALMDDGSVVLASKDYRLYIYRYVQLPQPSM